METWMYRAIGIYRSGPPERNIAFNVVQSEVAGELNSSISSFMPWMMIVFDCAIAFVIIGSWSVYTNTLANDCTVDELLLCMQRQHYYAGKRRRIREHFLSTHRCTHTHTHTRVSLLSTIGCTATSDTRTHTTLGSIICSMFYAINKSIYIMRQRTFVGIVLCDGETQWISFGAGFSHIECSTT